MASAFSRVAETTYSGVRVPVDVHDQELLAEV
jgi:hypothetical protein